MERILLTGGAGFVGQHLLARLAASFPGAEILPAEFDVRDRAAAGQAVRNFRPDACIHLAAIAAMQIARAEPDQTWQVNLHGTLAVAEAIMAEAPECLLVHASTADAYGRSFRSGQPVSEAAVLAPMNIYAATKAAADLALGVLAGEGLRVIRLRPFNHTGPGQAADFVVSAFARQVARVEAGLQPPVIHVGDLEAMRDFLDVRDVCGAYALCLEHAAAIPSGEILNIASGVSRRVGDILGDLLSLAGVEAKIEQDSARLRPADIPVAAGDASQAHALLGWRAEIPWERTLADILEDWRARVREEGK